MSAHDFDFLQGTWTVHNRKIRDNTDPECTEWIEFDARSEVSAILNGAGNVDQMWVDEFVGFTLRLWSPDEGVWRIWWSATNAPGVLDEPVIGGFTDGVGRFDGLQRIRDLDVIVRFEWVATDPMAPQWNQYFSRDAGQTWVHNWTMDFRRP
ncbi:MAG: hypothetical protein ABIR17_10670 [Pseudolysinimonas sp.]|uniref:hypothetical protein n=1 Tax=Pseudolysinimonas sp. TaxID=2680009 RepID=UPI003264BE07